MSGYGYEFSSIESKVEGLPAARRTDISIDGEEDDWTTAVSSESPDWNQKFSENEQIIISDAFDPEDLLNCCIPLPSREAQERLRSVQAQVSTLKRLQDEVAVELDALVPSILDRAFRGES